VHCKISGVRCKISEVHGKITKADGIEICTAKAEVQVSCPVKPSAFVVWVR
jgi:hypothetical protein